MAEELTPDQKNQAANEVAHAAKEHGCNCDPHAHVQENGVVLTHSSECSAFGEKALELLRGG